MIYWASLIIAGCLEIVGVIIMKKILEGKNILILVLIVCFILSFSFMSYAMKAISMGVVYAIWTGIGAAGGVIVGIVFFKEDKSFSKLFCVSVIILSSIGLKYLS